jgi:protein gp37
VVADTTIQWTDAGWNPVRGCSVISPGCTNCYAMRQAHRFSGPGKPYEGLTRSRVKLGPVWTGDVRLVREHLSVPLAWKQPRRIFVNSMSDLFHEGLTDEEICEVFEVMRRTPQHTFQILTKRPDRMPAIAARYALPNVWLGTSVENQEVFDVRIPHLLATPAVIRFLSCVPLLGPLDLSRFVSQTPERAWVIVGGESGPGARRFELDWAREIVRQTREAGVACFVKQLGAKQGFRDRKGGDPSEWPKELRVREWPSRQGHGSG